MLKDHARRRMANNHGVYIYTCMIQSKTVRAKTRISRAWEIMDIIFESEETTAPIAHIHSGQRPIVRNDKTTEGNISKAGH